MVIFEVIVNGVILGSIYLLFAQSFTLIYGTFRVMNMAQGAVLTLGAFGAYWAMHNLHIPFLVAALLASAFTAVINIGIDALAIRPLMHRQRHGLEANEFAPLVITLSLASILAGLMQNISHASVYVYPAGQFLVGSVTLFGVSVSWLQLVVVALAGLVGMCLYFWLRRSLHGLKVRAVATDDVAASLLGVRTQLVSATVYAVSGFLAGLVGVIVGLMYNSVSFNMGEAYLLIGFVVITVGGLGSLVGTACASLLVAFIQSIGNQFLTRPVVDLIVFATLFAVLIIRPEGFFGKDVVAQGVRRS